MAFDPEVATQAWMATLSGAARARSDAYFEGGYWLLLASAIITLLVNLLVLRLGWAARLSAWARRSRQPWLASLRFAIAYLALTTLITLPFMIWSEFIREHDYGLSNQGFGAWAADQAIVLVINTLILALLFSGVHAVIRRSPRDWWLGGTALTAGVLVVTIALTPVLFAPLLNDYTPLPVGPTRDAIVSMARANGVPADNVVLVDASRQSRRISANVAGLFGTTRIALNDNLLKQPADEVRAVMGHELGHYVLNHIWKLLMALTLLIALLLWLAARALPAVVARWGPGWGVTGLDDPAILPIGLTLMTLIGTFALTPAVNTLIRTQEMEADRFGLNVARAPDNFASIAMKLSQYRKIEPGPWEEAVFYDHPSGHTRVLTAMRWKAEHLGQPDVR